MSAVNVIEIVKSSAKMISACGADLETVWAECVCLYTALVDRPLMGLESEWVKNLCVKAINESDRPMMEWACEKATGCP